MPKEKKICFGFTKTSKQNTAIKQNIQKKESVQYIDCLDSKTIICRKNEGEVEEETKTDLVIPLNRSTKVHKAEETNSSKECASQDVMSDTESSNHQTLEDKAVKEILEGVKKPTNDQDKSIFSQFIIIKTKPKINVSNESTLDDYEQIPIGAFGKAMLRGMGWKPDKGIGKTERVVKTETPTLRPRGMGLGADKQQVSTAKTDESSKEEKLEIVKGAFIQVLSGSRRGQYGQIQGFDDEAGRVIVKLAMEGSPLTLSEHAFKLVSKNDYEKNSRVINASKYEEYKQRAIHSDANVMEQHRNTDEEIRNRRRNRSKTPTKKRNRKSPSPEESERKSSTFTDSTKHEKQQHESKSKKKSRHRSQSSSKHSKHKRN